VKGRIIAGIAGAALAIAGGVIARWEGTHYKAYLDVVGIPTICTGHTRGVKMGDVATKAQCEAYLIEDMRIAEQAVDRCISHPLPAHVRGALISATYNIGPKIVCESTLRKKMNAGDIEGGCRELLRWDNAGGKKYRGLTLRRQHEFSICWPDFSNVRSGSVSIHSISRNMERN
jgi:lysozyme